MLKTDGYDIFDEKGNWLASINANYGTDEHRHRNLAERDALAKEWVLKLNLYDELFRLARLVKVIERTDSLPVIKKMAERVLTQVVR